MRQVLKQKLPSDRWRLLESATPSTPGGMYLPEVEILLLDPHPRDLGHRLAPPFPCEERDAQRGQVTFPRSHSYTETSYLKSLL